MASPNEQTPWDFIALTDKISYHRPPPTTSNPNDLSLIVICSWMSANRKHISKYTNQYRQTHPNAEILVLESSVSDMLNTSLSEVFTSRLQTLQAQLKPAREILLSHLTSPTRRVILHVFSNGGAACATNLISELPASDRQKAFNAIILDSCPGAGTYQRSVHAFSLSLPKHPLAKIIGVPLIHLMICMFGLFFILFRAEHVMERIRRQLNDSALIDVRVPRLYVYSYADELVVSQDVASHAREAREKGVLKVEEVVFEDSAHCAHALAYKEKYWGAVDRVIAESSI